LAETLPTHWLFNMAWESFFSAHRIDSDDHLAARADRDVIWPIVTAMGLMVFRASMRMARVKPIHTFRVVIYSADVIAGFAIIFAVIPPGSRLFPPSFFAQTMVIIMMPLPS